MLYSTDDEHELGPGIPVTTQSMIKAFRHCHREAYYKYALRLQPKRQSLPLTRGKWVHALIQAHLEGKDWELEHKRWVGRFNKLFDEEKADLGDLPTEIERLMKSYFWHYGDPAFADQEWTVHEVEMTVEAMMPNGHLFRGRIDALVENAFGLWCVDHKSHKRLPDWDQRMLDEQSPLYIWALREMGIPVRGFIWNYLSTAGISVPRVVKAGTRFYSNTGESDYPTYVRAIKDAQKEFGTKFLNDSEEKAKVRTELKRLKEQRWKGPDAPQTSPHFRRDILEKSDDLIERVLKTTMRTSEEMHNYDFSDPTAIERNVNSCKGFMCNFRSLSMADLVNGESSMAQRREYRVGDPLAYYGTDDERIGG